MTDGYNVGELRLCKMEKGRLSLSFRRSNSKPSFSVIRSFSSAVLMLLLPPPPLLVLHISFLARMVRDDTIAGILSKSVINGALSTSQFSSVTPVQGLEIRYANFVKQEPGRARQNL